MPCAAGQDKVPRQFGMNGLAGPQRVQLTQRTNTGRIIHARRRRRQRACIGTGAPRYLLRAEATVPQHQGAIGRHFVSRPRLDRGHVVVRHGKRRHAHLVRRSGVFLLDTREPLPRVDAISRRCARFHVHELIDDRWLL